MLLLIFVLIGVDLAVQSQILHFCDGFETFQILDVALRRYEFLLQLLHLPLPLQLGHALTFQTSLGKVSARLQEFHFVLEAQKSLFDVVLCDYCQLPQSLLAVKAGSEGLRGHDQADDL